MDAAGCSVLCTYDPAFAKHSPGQLLQKELLQWAFENGLDYDWRLGDEGYKRDWASHTVLASTYVLPRNPAGRLFAAYLARRTWLARHAPPRLRGKIRGLLRSQPAGGERAPDPAADG
jgi:CelD/BcsL family acetyltransferase involved in cellulose biosynthesis